MIDHFWRLRVRWDATDDEIQAAYHRLAREVHPDLAPDASPQERERRSRAMARLNESWSVLEDPTARSAHRAELQRAKAARRPRPAPSRPAAAYAPVPKPNDEPRQRPAQRSWWDGDWAGFAIRGGGVVVALVWSLLARSCGSAP